MIHNINGNKNVGALSERPNTNEKQIVFVGLGRAELAPTNRLPCVYVGVRTSEPINYALRIMNYELKKFHRNFFHKGLALYREMWYNVFNDYAETFRKYLRRIIK